MRPRAALGRDIGRALALNRDHIERTTEKVAKALAETEETPRLRAVNGKSAR